MTDKVDQLIEVIKRKTKTECYQFKIEKEGKSSIFDIKLVVYHIRQKIKNILKIQKERN